MFRNAHRYLSHLVPGALALLATAACSDTSPNPAAPLAPAAPRLVSSNARPLLVSNGVKYRDSGAPHATGRSGSATLEGVAVFDAHGVIRLVITTGDLDSSAPAPGEIVKAQIKVYGADGGLLSVQNYNHLTGGGVQTFLLTGFAPDVSIRVQANVRGIDGHRTDVVTLTTGVAHAARLQVTLHLPASVALGQPVVINGVVSEVGGDVGTRADCVLYVDGVEVDRAENIWVDAGGVVTCAFTHTFTTAGRHTVEVRVNGGAAAAELGVIGGGDSGDLDVGGGSTATWTAGVEDRSVTTTSVLEYTWWKPDGSHKEYSNTEITTLRDQTISLQGNLGRAVSFPLAAVDLSIQTGGVEWELDHWTGLAAVVDETSGSTCMNQQIPEQGAILFVCNGLGGASFGYTRFAGNVTYHSYGYAHTFDALVGTPENYTWNGDPFTYSNGGGQVRALGSAVQLRLGVQDAQGTVTLSPLVALSPFSGVVSVTPYNCTLTSPENLEGGQQNYCTSERRDEAGWRGSATG
jgi:hypothetical protein